MTLDSVSKTVLIIGIESFTGKHLESYLSRNGFDVFGTSYLDGDAQRVFQVDITIKEGIKHLLETLQPDYIINLAGISFVGAERKELFYTVNVLAVDNILESIVEIENYTPKKIILVSSATVYGNQKSSILDEKLVPDPINHYGISKLSMEQIAKTYFERLDIIITRPFNYTGKGQEEHFLIPKIVSHFRDHRPEIELGNIDVFREFNDVEYVCEVYRRLLLTPHKNEIVNLCSGRLIALKEVIKQMNRIAGYNIDVKVNPKFVRANEIHSLSGSTEKLFGLIGRVEQQPFDKTLKDMYQ